MLLCQEKTPILRISGTQVLENWEKVDNTGNCVKLQLKNMA